MGRPWEGPGSLEDGLEVEGEEGVEEDRFPDDDASLETFGGAGPGCPSRVIRLAFV